MDKTVIERRLQLPLLNVCLAAVGKREGDLSIAKENLIHEVWKIVRDAGQVAPHSPQQRAEAGD